MAPKSSRLSGSLLDPDRFARSIANSLVQHWCAGSSDQGGNSAYTQTLLHHVHRGLKVPVGLFGFRT